ncbi:MAG: MarR family winged helix-turn-helix transcriptional regulator [Actinomycetes bacterium]
MALHSGLGFRLSRLSRALRRSWANQLSGLRLSPPEAAVVRGVAANPGCSLRALARELSADPMNAKRCVDDLEERGVLRSGSLSGDRRPRTLTLTDEGESLARAVHRMVGDQETWLNTALTQAERDHFEVALGKLEGLLGLVDREPEPIPSHPPAHLEETP